MDSRLILFLCAMVYSVTGDLSPQQGLTQQGCKNLCATLTKRFKGKGIFTATQAKYEMKAICTVDTSESKDLCKYFNECAARLAKLAQGSSTKKICKSVCPKKPRNATQVESSEARCLRCKSKVKFASKIAQILQVSLTKIIDIVCPAVVKQDMKSQIMCRQITNNIASSSKVIEQIANRICSALDICSGTVSIPADKCALRKATQRSSVFETTFKIINIISQASRPYLSHHVPELKPAFDVMEETAKCLSVKKSAPSRSSRRNRKVTYCQKLCANTADIVRSKLGGGLGDMTPVRRNFKEFCYNLNGKAENKCLVLYKATDRRSVLETLFRKQTCEQLDCNLYEMYPRWHCSLCKFNFMQQPIKTVVATAVNTIREIKKSIEILCNKMSDHRCDAFLAEQRQFLETLRGLMRKESICSLMGICKS